ncbi:MAG: hypothetical protein GY814_14685, partial [Gammaproteobacteria bacterium]|nr:hypothetical protein [Gammaproteobacteria bacterium]
QTDGSVVTQLAGNIEYKPFGPRTRMDLGNSFQQLRQYDDAYRLKSLTLTDVSEGVAPAITSTANTIATVGQPYHYDANETVEATGTPAPSFSFSGPAGFNVTNSGVVSWTPTGVGSFPVTITASNGVAPDADQSFTIVVSGSPADSVIDFSTYPPSGYGGGTQDQEATGTVTIEDNGTSLHLTGNRWQYIDYPYEITANTVIEFDFSSTHQGEVHGIGMDTDLITSADRTFKVHGTQGWGIRDYDNYPGDGSTVSYKIPIGQYYTGSYPYLLFVADDDATKDSDSIFSNIMIYEP